MKRGGKRAGDGDSGENGAPSDWTPPKRPVPTGIHVSPLSKVRAKALAEMGAMIERLEQAVRPSTPKPAQPSTPEPARPSASKAVQPSAPANAADAGPGLEQLAQRLEYALERIDSILERVALVASRIEEQAAEPDYESPRHEAQAALAPSSTTSGEPAFEPNERGITIVLTPVPDFQDLMEMQRALSQLPVAAGASVATYRNGEASFELVLRSGVSATQIVRMLTEITGRRTRIEEARPDAHRLRLQLLSQ